MRNIDLHTDAKWQNTAELVPGPHGGVVPLRYSQAALATFGGMAPIARFGTGIELQLAGAIRRIQYRVRVLNCDGYGFCAEAYAGRVKLLPTWRLDPQLQQEQAATFELSPELAATRPVLRLLFPTHTELEVMGVSVDAAAEVDSRFAPFDYRQLPGGLKKRWLVYGDSITQGANVTCPSSTWVDMTARLLGLCPLNLGIGGHGIFEPCVAADIATRTGIELISVHGGANWHFKSSGPPAALTHRVTEFVRLIRQGQPHVPVVLATPIYRRLGLNPQEVQLLRELRAAITAAATALRDAGDRRLFVIPGDKLLNRPDGLLADYLHISEFGAMQYAVHLAPRLKRVCAATPK